MELQNDYGAGDVTSRPQNSQLRPPDSSNFNIPPPPDDPTQIHHYPHRFQFFPQQQQHSGAVVDPFDLPQYNLIGLVGGELDSYRPPPSVNVMAAPHPHRGWVNPPELDSVHKLDLPPWKLESVGLGQISAMVDTAPNPNHTQFGDELVGFTSSKPEFEKQYSQSPGSISEIYETRYPNRENKTAITKKKKKHKCCTDKKEEDEALEREMKLMAEFVEIQLADHQERLHDRFTAAVERIDRARREREELWRLTDIETAKAQALTRAREKALASTREAVIVSYLEKMTGLKIEFPAQQLHGRRRKRLKSTSSNTPSLTSPIHPSSSKNETAECDQANKNQLLQALLELESNAGEQTQRQDCDDDHENDVCTNL